jgi:hypothetical protein
LSGDPNVGEPSQGDRIWTGRAAVDGQRHDADA